MSSSTIDRERPVPREARTQVFNEFLTRCATLGLENTGNRHSPWFSLNSGRTGFAYLLYRLYALGYGRDLLKAAERVIDETFECLGTLAVPEDIDLARMPTSLFHSEVGVWFVRALIKDVMGSRESALDSIDQFVRLGAGANASIDVTLGRAGVALGALSLARRCTLADQTRVLLLRELARGIAREIAEHVTSPPFKEEMLNAAHGRAGLVFTLLQCEREQCADGAFDRAWLSPIVQSAIAGEFGVRWPRTAREDAEEWAWAGWCNGAAGIAHTLLLAFETSGDAELLALARAAGYFTGQTPANNYTLCCGTVGQAYALFKLYEVTGESAWRRRGMEFAELAAARVLEQRHGQDSFISDALFSGSGALILLHAEIEQGVSPSMPILYV